MHRSEHNLLLFLIVIASTPQESGEAGGGGGGDYQPYPIIIPPEHSPYDFPENSNPWLPNYPYTHIGDFGTVWDTGGAPIIKNKISFPVLDKPNGVYYPFKFAQSFYWPGPDDPDGKSGTANVGYSVNQVNPLKLPVQDIFMCSSNPDLCKEKKPKPTKPPVYLAVPVPATDTGPHPPPVIPASTQPNRQGSTVKQTSSSGAAPGIIYGTKNVGK